MTRTGGLTVPLTVLRWSLGIVILVEAVFFLFSPAARHELARAHMPNAIRLLLGIGELAGAILLILPRTVAVGAWLLMFSFFAAIVVHLLHGMPNVGPLVIYSAAAWTVAAGSGGSK
jgi:DoxX-like family